MPTDFPEKRGPPSVGALETLRLVIVGVRLRMLGWRIEQACEERDHLKLLVLSDAWGELHRQTAERIGYDFMPLLNRRRHVFCERVRQAVPLIEREERRIARTTKRIRHAQSINDVRAYTRLNSIRQIAISRVNESWRRFSTSKI